MKATTARRAYTIALICFGAAGSAYAQDYMESAAFRLAGNTLTVDPPGGGGAPSTSYLATDGTGWTMRADRDTAPVPIRWFTYSDGKFCITREFRGDPSPDECGTYVFSGSDVKIALNSARMVSGHVDAEDPAGLEALVLGRTPQRLSGRAAVDALVGNTLLIVPLGARDRAHYVFHLMPGGMVTELADDAAGTDRVAPIDIRTNAWHLDAADRFCVSGKKGADCFAVSVVEDRVVLRPKKAFLVGILERGDTRHLSPAQMKQSDALLATLTDASLISVDPAHQDRGLYLGHGTWGEALGHENFTGPWVGTRTIRWMFRPDLRLLCTFNTSSSETPDFGPSNCMSVALSGNEVLLGNDATTPRRMRVIKGNLGKR